ncbi:MAG: histidine kinase, partial [Saprospiraceae bacterium]
MNLPSLILLGSLLILLFIGGLIIFVINHQNRLLVIENDKMRIEKNKELELAESAIHSQELERKRIGEDLHDEIAPLLVSAKMYLKSMNQKVNHEGNQPSNIASELIDQ